MSKKKKSPNTSLWTLHKFVNESHVPQKKASLNIDERTVDFYKHVATTYEKFAGKGVKMREITRLKTEEFIKWSIENGICERTAKDRASQVRAFVRAWRPGTMSKDKRGHVTHVFIERDVSGSLEQLFHARYLPENTRIGSNQTIRQYGNSFRAFTEHLGHTATLADLTDQIVGGWLRNMVEQDGRPRVTANGMFQRVVAIWNWAAKCRLVEQFPTVKKFIEPEQIPKAWSQTELTQLVNACHKVEGKIGQIKASDFWVAFHYLAWDTGERTGALLGLKWTMLNFQTAILSVPAEIRKGGLKAMVYYLKPATLAKLKAIRSPTRDIVFSLPKGAWNFYYHYKKLVISAGLAYEPHKTGPQKIRRTFASYIAAKGGDPTLALRHSSTQVTLESYLDPTIASPEPPNKLLFELGDN